MLGHSWESAVTDKELDKLVGSVLIVTGLLLIAIAVSGCQSARGHDPAQRQKWEYMVRFGGHK
jgi:hypothetical protein